MRDLAAGVGGMLAEAGISHGDRVAVMCENRFELLALWAGCSWTGAILVPLNPATRGPQLAHVLENAAPKALALEPALAQHLDALPTPPPELERLWLLEDGDLRWGGLAPQPFPAARLPVAAGDIRPGDTLAILYTSGTTGPSKGVCCPHAQSYWWGRLVGEMLGVTESDVLHTTLPLYHSNAMNAILHAGLHGAHLVVAPRFSASRFWSRLAESGATITYLLGAVVSILAKAPPSPEDRAHRVRVALSPATPTDLHTAFRERFGIALVDAFGMTETNAVIGPLGGRQRPGTMGVLYHGFDARVVDGDDSPVPDGAAGELVLRADEPYAFATGYWRMPEQTATAWRNLWFHTGDRVIRDADGSYRFVDRLKDAIRRRGENVSAWEVEQVLLLHPDVAAAAVVPVPSELAEDEVMAFVVGRNGTALAPAALVEHARAHLAAFAVPRYVEVVDALPLTENGKVRKFVLRERGVGPATWDRERPVEGVERRS
jgi:crotonobetaine/carnitine-CoA ligase